MMANNKDPSNYGWRVGSTQLKVSTTYVYMGETITSDYTIKKSPGDKGVIISSSTPHSEGNN